MNSILQPRCSLECCAGVTEKPQKGPAVPFGPDPFDFFVPIFAVSLSSPSIFQRPGGSLVLADAVLR